MWSGRTSCEFVIICLLIWKRLIGVLSYFNVDMNVRKEWIKSTLRALKNRKFSLFGD